MTVSDVISQTGGGADAEDVFKARRQELDVMAEHGLVFDTDPAVTDDKGKAQAADPDEAGATDADGAASGSDGDNGTAEDGDPDAKGDTEK